MALGVSEEHLELAASVRGWAGRPDSPMPGLLGLHLPEESGGQGYGLGELAVALEELGDALVPGGFLPTVLASAALARAGAASGEAAHAGAASAGAARSGMPGEIQKLLAGLADGSRSGAVALGAALTGTPAADGGLILDGESGPVLGGSLADLVVLPVLCGPGGAGTQERWAVVDAADLAVTGLDSLDLTRPLATVRADRLPVPAGRVLPGLGRSEVTSLAATLFAAEASGIAGWAVRTAAEYAKIRHQFGRPIGQFQAVKHRCARMLTAAEQAAGGRVGRRGRVGRGARAGSGEGAPSSLCRRGGRGRGARRGGQLHPRVHPGPRRDRLHLGAPGAPVLPARAVAARAARPGRGLGPPGRGAGPRRRPPAGPGRSARGRRAAARADPRGPGRRRGAGAPGADRADWRPAAGWSRICPRPGAGRPARWSSWSSRRR